MRTLLLSFHAWTVRDTGSRLQLSVRHASIRAGIARGLRASHSSKLKRHASRADLRSGRDAPLSPDVSRRRNAPDIRRHFRDRPNQFEPPGRRLSLRDRPDSSKPTFARPSSGPNTRSPSNSRREPFNRHQEPPSPRWEPSSQHREPFNQHRGPSGPRPEPFNQHRDSFSPRREPFSQRREPFGQHREPSGPRWEPSESHRGSSNRSREPSNQRHESFNPQRQDETPSRSNETHEDSLKAEKRFGRTTADKRTKDDPRMPIAIKYTTAASTFVPGARAAAAILRGGRRQEIHKVYMADSSSGRPVVSKQLRELKVPRSSIDNTTMARMLQTLSMPNAVTDGILLECSPIPQLPVNFLKTANTEEHAFEVEVSAQSKEDQRINGTESRISTTGRAGRFPLVLWLHGVVDTGNIAGLFRSAVFYGVDAIALSLRAT